MSTCPNGHRSESGDYCDVCGAPLAEASAPSSAAAVPAGAESDPGTAGGAGITCPNCSFPNLPDALFCENCGYDFTTGSLPEPEHGSRPPGSVTVPATVVIPVAAPTELIPVEEPGAGSPVPAATSPAAGAEAEAVTPGASAASGPVAPSPGSDDAWVAEVWIDPEWYSVQRSEEPLPSGGLPEIVVLRQRSLLVGRSSVSRDIHPQIDCSTDSGVSRRQCQLNTDGQRWWVEDLQSSNGTYVGAAGSELPTVPIPPGQRHEIVDGDRIFIGAWTRLVLRKALPGEA